MRRFIQYIGPFIPFIVVAIIYLCGIFFVIELSKDVPYICVQGFGLKKMEGKECAKLK